MPHNPRLLIVSPVSSCISLFIESIIDSLSSMWPPGDIMPFELFTIFSCTRTLPQLSYIMHRLVSSVKIL